ncbi:ABC transporter permease [Paraburkholderia sp. Ac-20336]|uniref:ABC transporter permease n=1 Tax=Burkholderiaceae TaxID=119060 RepID=UPI00141F3ECB|nr:MULTISPECIES: ABC transporter permease [Burkholderiaceae]MBN3801748.1 ABC transporter permease [Paraburkholderia sp. Ac-20336]MBN3845598.1 ABC transporter permease [Paraburkholderia sp. Ac-20342]NIF51036.1 ABC transporter permease [Burkholderia sp. Ax-1724]NIF75872.1 ABC transporter permease [Paraburkholderia sp. Cy-641]
MMLAQRSLSMKHLSRYGIVAAFVAICIALSSMNPYFLTINNLLNILQQVSINGLLAIGMTFVILAGGIDLSVGSVLAFAGMVAASVVAGDAPHAPFLAVVAGVAVGVASGALNGLVIARFRVPAFVVTLGMLSIARGATQIYNDGMPISGLSDAFLLIGQGKVAGVPIPVLIFLALFAASLVVLRYSRFGRYVYAVGGNEKSARASGVPTRLILLSVYAICGGCAGLAGVVLNARTTSALTQAGVGYELDAIAAVVIGGTSLSGGIGGVAGTLFGVLIIGVINNGLDLMGVSSYYQQVIKGAVIVCAVLLDIAARRESN